VFGSWTERSEYSGGRSRFITTRAGVERVDPGGCPCTEIASSPGPLIAADVDDDRIVAYGERQTLVFDRDGKVLIANRRARDDLAILGDPLGGDTFYVTSITGNHGQAFDGFLHLAESSYEEHPGASELFRGHEAAHEWFGHRVGWKSYRDQWLSESLAEYASMMFVQSTVKDGPKHFDEILNAYDSILKGSLSSAFSKYMRPWLLDVRANARKRVGPIGIGQRASTGDYPIGYDVQVYVKGPLVIHMLRSMLQQKTHNDDLFVKILRDYVHEYSGKLATTADFQKIIERDAPGNWKWFFDDWVYGAEIPTIRYSYKVEPDGNAYRLTLNVKRSDVAPDFVIIAPVRLEFDGNKFATIFVPVKDASVTVQKQIPANPKNVVLGPDHSLLANIKKE
jgi:hypothetical protein